MLFTGFLIDNNLKSTSVRSYISAIRAVLTENTIEINDNKFLLNSLTRACKLQNDKIITRLPIRKDLFLLLVKEIGAYYGQQNRNQPYLVFLYRVMFTAAYYGLLRIGEISQGPHIILAKNVHMGINKNKIQFVLNSSKTHSQGGKPQLVKIVQKPLKQEKDRKSCALIAKQMHFNLFSVLHKYIKVRPMIRDLQSEQFFVFSDNAPVRPEHLRCLLKWLLINLNLPYECYSMHSTRVGRASDLLDYGLSVETIKKIGRWKLNAVFTYLRS